MGRQAAKHNLLEFHQYEDIKKERARRIREMRFLMGLSQAEVVKGIKMNAGQYSRIESGELDGTTVIKYLEPLFAEWKEKEIKRLSARIEYIRTL